MPDNVTPLPHQLARPIVALVAHDRRKDDMDPLTPQPHDVDVKALLRLAVLYDVPIACNRNSADHMISSPLFAAPEQYRKARGQQGPSYAPWAR